MVVKACAARCRYVLTAELNDSTGGVEIWNEGAKDEGITSEGAP
jgi:hypothetical protein